ncbi:MAG: SGNH/GDSL hydrolase family protein [Saprospiraceae bacterium]|nr:SGNH/GDSL hydrolase family protein [Saprospiraceae bacterium]
MVSHIRLYSRLVLSIPILPILYWQGKKSKAAVPDLPPAKHPTGIQRHPDASLSFKVLSFGESAFAGIGIDDHQNTITGIMAQELSKNLRENIEWEVVAKSGYNAEQVREELVDLSTIKTPDLIIIGLGANDTFEIHFPKKWKRDMTRLIDQIRRKHGSCPILLAHLPPVHQFPVLTPLLQWFMGNFMEEYHLVNQQLMELEQEVYYVDQRIDFDTWTNRLPDGFTESDLFCDGVHPGKLAHKLWGQEIAHFVLQKKLLVK